MGRLPLVAAFALCACGRVSSAASDGGTSSVTTGSDDGDASTATAATSVPPAPLALQPAVSPDAPCNTPPGQVVQLVSANAYATAIDSSFVYAGTPQGITQTPRAGGSATQVSAVSVIGSSDFILGDGALLFPSTKAMDRVQLSNDSTAGPIYMAMGDPFPHATTDGLNVWAVFHNSPNIYEIPIDGSPPLVTLLSPASAIILATAAGDDGLYVVLAPRGAPHNSLLKVPRGGGAAVTVADTFGGDPIALDDEYVYSVGNAGNGNEHGIYKMKRDGSSTNTLLAETTEAFFLAVDAHDVYFTTESMLGKVDKVAGGTVTKITDVPSFTPVFVVGGNLYWSVADSGLAIAPGVYTTCK
jgi:hypothetical protein